LGLAFDESAVESRVEEWRMVANELFVDDEFLFIWCFANKDSDKLSGLAVKTIFLAPASMKGGRSKS
jgi:hypothetical protein